MAVGFHDCPYVLRRVFLMQKCFELFLEFLCGTCIYNMYGVHRFARLRYGSGCFSLQRIQLLPVKLSLNLGFVFFAAPWSLFLSQVTKSIVYFFFVAALWSLFVSQVTSVAATLPFLSTSFFSFIFSGRHADFCRLPFLGPCTPLCLSRPVGWCTPPSSASTSSHSIWPHAFHGCFSKQI